MSKENAPSVASGDDTVDTQHSDTGSDVDVVEFSKFLSDPTVAILVGPNEYCFHVHKNVACTLDFFAAALNARHAFVESVTNTIRLSEDDVYAVSALLSFLYKQTYDYTKPSVTTSNIKIRHAKVYLIADKYNCPVLKDLAQTAINTCSSLSGWPQLQYWEFVYKHSNERCGLRICYDSGTLRAKNFVNVLHKNHGPPFKRILEECPDLAYDLLLLAVQNREE